jgi:endonuclease/exonuclease/phosphatase family metal-dependent hydrolase
MKIKIATYNIHKGIGGVDRRYRLERIVEVIRHYEPDVVLLQEVDDGVPRSQRDRQADKLANLTGLEHTQFQPNVKLREGVYGNAILSRFPIHDPVDIDLTIPLKKRRRAQIARIDLVPEGSHVQEGRHRSVTLINLHLGLAGFERRIQLTRLLQNSAVEGLHRDAPCLLGGDFNDVWGAIGMRIMKPAGFESASECRRTFPAVAPVRPLDAIYYRGDCAPHQVVAGRIDVARKASDHLPLIAEFEVGLGD